MKKLLLCFLVSASLIACTNQETKKAENSEEDKDTGTWTSLDAKTIKVRQLLESYGKNDSSVVYEIIADTVKFKDQFANYQENGVTKVNPGGRVGFVQDTRNAHQLFSDISLTTDNMRTFVRKDGLTATLWWGMWSGTGKFTKNKSTVPVHAYFYWKDDKIISGGRFFDPTVSKEEFAASQKK
ncbi:MAG: hypothetical protein NTY72_10065 [Bacteroidetes bacterium]|nr:hypothetical protein [Bacteroidota bacterium]